MNRAPLGTALAALLLLSLGCSDSDSPTAPQMTTLAVTSASVSVGGQSVQDGSVYHHNHGQSNGLTRFEAHLRESDHPAPGHVMWVRFGRPHGMMNASGSFELHDDGTHGDQVPGDGIYCLDDPSGAYGFHHAGARHGEYHYEFYGVHRQSGTESNHHTIRVTVSD